MHQYKIQKNQRLSFSQRFFKELSSYWWVGLFILAISSISSKSISSKDEQILKLRQQLSLLESKRTSAKNEKDLLLMQIESQEDPMWIEMVLMKKLGVVPEGQTKVHFSEEALTDFTCFEGL